MASNRTHNKKNKTQKKQVKDKKINTADGGGTCISKQTITTNTDERINEKNSMFGFLSNERMERWREMI